MLRFHGSYQLDQMDNREVLRLLLLSGHSCFLCHFVSDVDLANKISFWFDLRA